MRVNGGIPNMLIHFPPKCLRIGRRNLSAIIYMPGTMNKVMKKANINPKIKVQLKGFQKATLSPPKKICGFNSLNKVTKLILNPIAIGMKPNIAVSFQLLLDSISTSLLYSVN